MADLAVRADTLGKRYGIGLPPRSLREALGTLPARGWRAVKRAWSPAAPESVLWAVRDLSFEVARGEVLGIVGPNGSGKSTVLRLASGITEPTEGWIATRGRVATLLELGTAFHPDLTGRENVLLSGIVLGMRAAAVRRRFDEIVEFAGVGRFVDTPVGHYSSGMYMRLAFAVAAHLDADVLLVDEALAVGDLGFQDRCLAKIGSVREQGRTVLFVTHSVSALRRLCTRALFLSGGRLAFTGSAEEVARRYEALAMRQRRPVRPVAELPAGSPDAVGRGLELRFFGRDGAPGAAFPAGMAWRVWLDFELERPARDVLAAVTLGRVDGTTVLTLASARRPLGRGRYRTEFTCDLPLAPADLVLGVELWSGDQRLYHADDAAAIEITEAPGVAPLPTRRGLLLAPRLAEIRPLAGAGGPRA